MKLIFSLLFSISTLTHAQNKVGNGGDVVSCKNSIALLDFYEVEKNTIPNEKKHYQLILNEKFSRIESVAPKIFSQYKKRQQNIEAEIEFKKGIRLTDVTDSLELYLPKKCELIQIAIRKKTTTENEKKFIIDQELWKKLSNTHKAGLLSHEIIYEHLSQLGQKDSIAVRKINCLVFSTKSKPEDYWKLIQELKIPLYP